MLKKLMQTSIKATEQIVEVSRDGRVKKYTNKSSRDNHEK